MGSSFCRLSRVKLQNGDPRLNALFVVNWREMNGILGLESNAEILEIKNAVEKSNTTSFGNQILAGKSKWNTKTKNIFLFNQR